MLKGTRIMTELSEKKRRLIEYLRSLGSVAVAFSGGVDSSFLLYAAKEALGDRVLAVTARSATYPVRELHDAEAFAEKYGIRQKVIVSEELDIREFSGNPPNRCYLCKHELMTKIFAIARAEGFAYVAEGSNMDDLGDYRPGLAAAKELGAVSPLREAQLTKAEIRALSREAGLATWDKPSFACLASRIPYGSTITREKLGMIEKAEQFLLNLGFKQVRVRHHGDVARVELASEELPRVFAEGLAPRIDKALRGFGFPYVALDLAGYRTGSMNDVLPESEKTKS